MAAYAKAQPHIHRDAESTHIKSTLFVTAPSFNCRTGEDLDYHNRGGNIWPYVKLGDESGRTC